MLGCLSADIICSEKRTVFRERSSGKTVSFEEQIMSKYKYPSIFPRHMEAIVFIVLQILFATCSVLKIGEHHSDISQVRLRVVPLSLSPSRVTRKKSDREILGARSSSHPGFRAAIFSSNFSFASRTTD